MIEVSELEWERHQPNCRASPDIGFRPRFEERHAFIKRQAGKESEVPTDCCDFDSPSERLVAFEFLAPSMQEDVLESIDSAW